MMWRNKYFTFQPPEQVFVVTTKRKTRRLRARAGPATETLSDRLRAILPGAEAPLQSRFAKSDKTCMPTCKMQRSIFIQGNERGVEQHRAVILGDDAMVGGLQPRLVLVDWVGNKAEGNRQG